MPNIPLRNGGPKARIAVIPGDGIGKEVTPEAVKVIRAATAKRNRPLEFVEFDWGADKYPQRKSHPAGGRRRNAPRRIRCHPLRCAWRSPRALQPARRATFSSACASSSTSSSTLAPPNSSTSSDPSRDRGPSIFPPDGLSRKHRGLYVGVGGFFKKGTADEIAVQEDVNSRKGVERIIRHAFDYARARKLKRLCMSDKSNAMTFAGDLWQRVFKSVRAEYPEIDSRHLYIDTFAMELVREPEPVRRHRHQQPLRRHHQRPHRATGRRPRPRPLRQHSSRQDLALRASPRLRTQHRREGNRQSLRAVSTSGMMLEFLGWNEEAELLKQSVKSALWDGISTIDLGGTKMTGEVGDWLANYVAKH